MGTTEDEQLPAGVGRLFGRVSNLETDMSGMKADLNHILVTLDKVADRQNAPQKGINWGWVVSGVGTLLVLIVTLIAPLYQAAAEQVEQDKIYNEQILDLTRDQARLQGFIEGRLDVQLQQGD